MRTITNDYRDAQILNLGSGGERGPYYSGGVANGLARMVNAIVAQQDRHPVPEPSGRIPDETPERPPGWVAPNTARRPS